MSDSIATSETHPLELDIVHVPGTRGRIGMTLLPGRSSDWRTITGVVWRRDLATDLEVIREASPCLVLSLNEPHEFPMLGVPTFEAALRESGLPWRLMPIHDGGVPDAAFETRWRDVGAEARACLRAGNLVVIHCRAGLGRTGTIAALLLVELGSTPDEAIRAVRAARPNTIETDAQERYVRAATRKP